ncbi:hypothetical protein TELCIR_10824 [Teladorsagia circumcincta]|uniref:Uncharacterized protein n=1 Tax=Teladorsagia circumcincta TaxID=45464 RepID=A0A2G9UB30_TELCI|nr:hypothetical protein TELCIR_10824 [Teladorsagia circumcincta]
MYRCGPPMLFVSVLAFPSQTHSFESSSRPPPLDDDESRERSGATSFSYLKTSRNNRMIDFDRPSLTL